MRIATDSYVHATLDDALTKAERLNAQDEMFQALRSPTPARIPWRFLFWVGVSTVMIAWMHYS